MCHLQSNTIKKSCKSSQVRKRLQVMFVVLLFLKAAYKILFFSVCGRLYIDLRSEADGCFCSPELADACRAVSAVRNPQCPSVIDTGAVFFHHGLQYDRTSPSLSFPWPAFGTVFTCSVCYANPKKPHVTMETIRVPRCRSRPEKRSTHTYTLCQFMCVRVPANVNVWSRQQRKSENEEDVREEGRGGGGLGISFLHRH